MVLEVSSVAALLSSSMLKGSNLNAMVRCNDNGISACVYVLMFCAWFRDCLGQGKCY